MEKRPVVSSETRIEDGWDECLGRGQVARVRAYGYEDFPVVVKRVGHQWAIREEGGNGGMRFSFLLAVDVGVPIGVALSFLVKGSGAGGNGAIG